MAARPRKEEHIRLNISLPEEIVMKSKIYAIEHRQTFSGLVEELLRERLGIAASKPEPDFLK